MEGERTNFRVVRKIENTFREKYRTYDGVSIVEGTKGREIAQKFSIFDDIHENSKTIRDVCNYFFDNGFDNAPDTIREINHLVIDRNPYVSSTAHFTKLKYIILTKEHGDNRINPLEQFRKDDIISEDDWLLMNRFKRITDKFIAYFNEKGREWLNHDSLHIEGQHYTEDQKYEKYDKSTLDLRVRSQYHKDRLFDLVKLDNYRTPFFIDESFPTFGVKFFYSFFFVNNPILKGVLFIGNVFTRKNILEEEAHWLDTLADESFGHIIPPINVKLMKHFRRAQGGVIHTQQERQTRIASNNYWLQRLLTGKVDLITIMDVLNIKPIGKTPKESLKKYVLKQRAKGLLDWDLFSKIYIYCQRKY